jgi:hypothetical protein
VEGGEVNAKKYRKKPIVIEAYRNDTGESIFIDTLEGRMEARPGDYIITGVRGEQYPCKPDIFLATYEDAEADRLDEAAK